MMLERVENRVKPGTPDLYVSHPKIRGWVELKYLAGFPARPTTPVKLSEWTSEQRAFASRAARFGTKCWLVVGVEQEVFVFDGARFEDTIAAEEFRRAAQVLPRRGCEFEQVLDALERCVVQ